MLNSLLSVSLSRHPGSPAGRRTETENRSAPCSTCALNGVCLPRNVSARDMGLLDALSLAAKPVRHDAMLYRGNDPFTGLFAVRGGSFKSVGTSGNGLSKVTGFHLPGDIMGFEGIEDDRYHYSVVALEDSEVCRIPYGNLMRCASSVPGLQTGLLKIISGDINRDQGLMLLLGAMSAEQRIAAFLLSLSRRYRDLHYAPHRFGLRMTRRDIGSYLGLSQETVTRVFTKLVHQGLIAVDRRDVELTDVAGLTALVDSW